MIIEQLITYGFEKGCSDIHLTEESPVIFRKNGILYKSKRIFTKKEMQRYLETLKDLMKPEDLDLGGTTGEGIRYRIHLYRSNGKNAAAIRIFFKDIPSMKQLELPGILDQLIKFDQGLILICGATGSGKSTTMAALIETINQSVSRHIVTIEDPIEYIYSDHKSLIHQRQLGTDTFSFSSGVRSALREDPDIILVGEMRDPETISAVLTAAETGHLVLSTLHTENAVQAVNRMIDSFSGDQRGWIRLQLSSVLSAVVSQRLIFCPGQGVRKAVFEVLTGTEAVKNTIRTGKLHLLTSLMQTGGEDGMITLEQDFNRLVDKKMISQEEAKVMIEKMRFFEGINR